MKFTVVFADKYVTYIGQVFEGGQHCPYQRRTVQIELTEEQVKQLQPRVVGQNKGKEIKEEVFDSWLEVE